MSIAWDMTHWNWAQYTSLGISALYVVNRVLIAPRSMRQADHALGGQGLMPNQQPGQGGVSEAAAIELTLPYPPSLNAIFRKFNGAHISAAYRAWRDEAGWTLKAQRPVAITGPVMIDVLLKAPDKRRRDLDNVGFKAIIDLLVKHEIIEADDSRIVREIRAKWVPTGAPCTVSVRSL